MGKKEEALGRIKYINNKGKEADKPRDIIYIIYAFS
jgi:hypothetical protein